MSEYHYREAQKLAEKEYKKATSRGESPYPVRLDEMLSSGQIAEGAYAGLEQVPLLLVTGTKTEGRKRAFARNFMPLLDHSSEFATKWKVLCEAHLNEGINDPVKLYEYRNRFYVEEGNKRVSVLKYFDADSIDANVYRVPSAQDDSEEALNYEAFSEFYKVSGLRTVEFSQRTAYEELQRELGKDPGEIWTEDERKDFTSCYYYFHKEYVEIGGEGTLPYVCDALLTFISLYGWNDLKDRTPRELHEMVHQSECLLLPKKDKITILQKLTARHHETAGPARPMRILAVADDESAKYYSDYTSGSLKEFDLILACGDLNRSYLEFLTTMAPCPVLYIRGNHDDPLEEEPPGGCICVEDTVYVHEGLRIAGLGGSYKYRDGQNMFTEEQMRRRAEKLETQIKKHNGIDILMTHAAAKGINDFDTVTHRGFQVFRELLLKYHPAYLVHGHMHKNYGIRIPQRIQWQGTTVINAYEHCVFEIGGASND